MFYTQDIGLQDDWVLTSAVVWSLKCETTAAIVLEYEKNNIPEKSVRTAVASKRVIAKYRLQQDVEFNGESSIQGRILVPGTASANSQRRKKRGGI